MERKYYLLAVIILFLLIVGIYNLFGASEEAESRVKWVFDLVEGMDLAKREDKLVLIDFYADWCSWCEVLDRETYANEEVAYFLNENLVCVKIDAEEQVELAVNFDAGALPTIVFLSSGGREMGRIKGYEPPSQFLGHVMEIVNQQY